MYTKDNFSPFQYTHKKGKFYIVFGCFSKRLFYWVSISPTKNLIIRKAMILMKNWKKETKSILGCSNQTTLEVLYLFNHFVFCISCNWESIFIKNLGWTCDRPFVFLGAFGVFSWIQYSMPVLQFLLELGSIVPVYLIYIISFILFLPKCVQSLYALRAALRTAVFIFFWRNAWSWVRPSGGSPDPNVCSTGGDSTYVRGGFTVASAQFFQTRHHHSVIFSTWCVFRLQ